MKRTQEQFWTPQDWEKERNRVVSPSAVRTAYVILMIVLLTLIGLICANADVIDVWMNN